MAAEEAAEGSATDILFTWTICKGVKFYIKTDHLKREEKNPFICLYVGYLSLLARVILLTCP